MEGRASMHKAVKRFIACAGQHKGQTFLVAAMGCGVAGYTR